MAVTSEKGRNRPRRSARRKMKKTVKRRSAAAAALASPRYRKRVIKSTKTYSRKGKAPAREEDSAET
jgi:stalled ribosome alternative rescue factor ArfA